AARRPAATTAGSCPATAAGAVAARAPAVPGPGPGRGRPDRGGPDLWRGRRLAPPVVLRVGPVGGSAGEGRAEAVGATGRRGPAVAVSESAQPAEADRSAEDRRLERLRGASMGAAVMLVIQFGLGVGVNLYVTLPAAGRGGRSVGDAF